MPRLLHMADVHLGARHDDLGPVAAAQRERQFDAFKRGIDLAIAEKVDVVLVCGDLFDSNSQPKRSIERAGTEFGRLAQRHIPVVVIPGTHDCYDAGSIYRVFNLTELSGAADPDMVTVLTDTKSSVEFANLGLTVRAKIFSTKRGSESPLIALGVKDVVAGGDRNWQVGMVHGSIAVPGRFGGDDVSFTDDEIAQTGLDYLALGHWHSFREGKAGKTVWAYSGAPEPVALDQDGAGQVLLVKLDEQNGKRTVTVEPRTVGRTRFHRMEVDAASVGSQADLESKLRELADKDLVLDARVVGVRSDGLDLNVEELEKQLAGGFLRIRVRDVSTVALGDVPLAPPDSIQGGLMRSFQARIIESETSGDTERAAELTEALRIGLLLLDDPQRVTLA